MGSITFPLTQQIANTIDAHGYLWAFWHYVENKNGPRLSAFEWRILAPVSDVVLM